MLENAKRRLYSWVQSWNGMSVLPVKGCCLAHWPCQLAVCFLPCILHSMTLDITSRYQNDGKAHAQGLSILRVQSNPLRLVT